MSIQISKRDADRSTADQQSNVFDAVLPIIIRLNATALRFQQKYPQHIKTISLMETNLAGLEAAGDEGALQVECSEGHWTWVTLYFSFADADAFGHLFAVESDAGAGACATCSGIYSSLEACLPSPNPGQVDWTFIALKRAALAGQVDWLIPGIMERGKLAALFGPPKAGKSLMALQWAIETAESGRPVLYLDEENDPAEIHDRALAMGKDLATLTKDGNFHYRSFTDWCVDSEEGAAKILEQVESTGASLVVFDSWAKFFAHGSQNDDAAVNRAYRLTLKPLRAQGTGVLRLDHTGHGDASRPAGSVQKLADVDHNWQITVAGEKVTLTHRENRTNRGEDVIALRRQVSPALWHVPLSARAAQVPQEGPEALTVVELLDEAGIPPEWSGDRAGLALSRLGQGRRKADILAAQRERKSRPPAE